MSFRAVAGCRVMKAVLLALGLCLGCAAAELPPPAAPAHGEPPSAANVRAETALVFGRAEASCPVDDATCCAAVAGRMREDRARGDDYAADEEAERLALFCPARRGGALPAEQRSPAE